MRKDIRLLIRTEGLDVIKQNSSEKNYNLITSPDIYKKAGNFVYIGWNRIGLEFYQFIRNELYEIEDKNITYKFAVMGEEIFEDIDIYEYISDEDKDSDIPTVEVMRVFNDNEITNILNKRSKDNESKQEVESIEY